MKKALAIISVLGLAASANAAVVINEYLTDPDVGTDAGEFVELYNNGVGAVDISNWMVLLINGSNGNSYSTATIPAATSLAAGDYYVIGNAATINAAYPGVVDLDFNYNNIIQNGAPDGILLVNDTLVPQDAVNYEADGAWVVGPYTAAITAEGGTGLTRSRVIANTTEQISNSRLPNGVDTDSNQYDFANTHATPGSANVGVLGSLPFTDNFDTTNSAWKYGFVPQRVVDPLTVVGVATASSNGGNVLEVVDTSGGGDANWLPDALSLVNVEGEIWIPADSANPWSTGIGVSERSNTNWFSTVVGNGFENGFYLEYQNGGGILNKASIPPIAGPGGEARLIAVNAVPSLGTGSTALSTGTVLGSSAVAATKGAWNDFRIAHDQAGNRLYAEINGVVLYDGAVPAGHSPSGGVYVGFAERHTGNPVAGEGTYIDGLVINTTLPPTAGVPDWSVF